MRTQLVLGGLSKGTSRDGRELAPGTVLFEGELAPGITDADFVLLVRRHGIELVHLEDEPEKGRGARKGKATADKQPAGAED